jgi:hypothetical protein
MLLAVVVVLPVEEMRVKTQGLLRVQLAPGLINTEIVVEEVEANLVVAAVAQDPRVPMALTAMLEALVEMVNNLTSMHRAERFQLARVRTHILEPVVAAEAVKQVRVA